MKKLSKSEAGKLGAYAGVEYMQKVKTLNIQKYLLNPNHCKMCDSILKYEKRKYTYCSHFCAAKFYNKEKGFPIKIKKTGGNRKKIMIERFNNGQISDRPTLKRYLIEFYSRKCFCCELTEWNNQEIPIEIDHIDGNASNNMPNNLRLLCPNCHAQTPTAKGKNRGNGRKSLGISRS